MTADELAQLQLAFRPALVGEGRARARALATDIMELWREGEPIDVPAALAQHPELAGDKSIVLDLIYEEFCLRAETAGPPDPDEFYQRFPALKSKLRGLLGTHGLYNQIKDLLPQDLDVPWPNAGEAFLGFVLVRELGRGGFARVFLAQQPALGDRLVAVKIAFHGGTEAQVLGRLGHPNIVPVYSVHKDPMSSRTLVCMPYLGSATLCDVVDRAFGQPGVPSRARIILEAIEEAGGDGAVPSQEPPAALLRRGTYVDGVVYLGAQIADALAFVHARGLCHRDLKPSNVLLTPQGRPMLLDFNLAADAGIIDHRLVGTLPYMAPEQLGAIGPEAAAPAEPVGPRSDLFSLGVILFELLTGEHPFGPVSLALPEVEIGKQLLQRQRSGPRPLRPLNPHVERRLASAIEQCLAFEPCHRPQSAAELATALGSYLRWPRRLHREIAKRPLALFAAALLLLAIGLGAVYVLPARAPEDASWLARGLSSYQEGRYEEAVDHLNRAIDADGGLAEAWFARGRAYQQFGEYTLALESYRKADSLSLDGRARACMGYCASRLGRHGSAVAYYNQAIETLCAPAEVFNNRGYSWLALNEFDQAETSLGEAIRRSPRLQAAYHNRALVDIQRAFQVRGHVPGPGIADIEMAIELGPVTAGLYRDAAVLHALVARQAPSHVEPALLCMQKAVDLGQDPAALASDRALIALYEEPQFQALIKQPSSPHPPQKPNRLLDPVNDTRP